MNGPGTLTLSNTNTYSGGTILNGGTTQISGPASLGASSGVLKINNAALEVTDYSGTSSRNVQLGSANSTIDVDAGVTYITSGTFSNVSGLVGGLNVTGPGKLILTGTSTYTGTTSVSGSLAMAANAANNTTAKIVVNTGGTFDVTAKSGFTVGGVSSQILTVGGTVLGNVTVGSSGELNGSGGTVNGNVIVSGTLEGGANGAYGTLNTGALTLSNGSTLSLKLDATAGSLISSSSSITLGAGASDRVALTITLTSQPVDTTVFTILQGTSLVKNGLFTYGGVALNNGDQFTVYPGLNGNTGSYGETFSITYGATSDTLTALASVPEPSTWGLVAAGFSLLAFSRRSRRRSA